MKKPVIGITLDLASNNEKYSYAWRPWYAARRDYSNCVAAAGGIPVLLPYSAKIEDTLDVIDGLILTGSDEDIHPRFYGQEIISDRVKTNPERTEFEFSLTEKAIKRNMPILGICNGMQLINVLFGGTLIQNIDDHPTYADSEINHEQPHPKNEPTHEILINKNSLLKKLAPKDQQVFVNTTHHQAVDKLGKGLTLSAKAPDGIIEALEAKSYNFLVGVQWHCEYLNSELDTNLFKRLVEESSKI